MKQTEHALSARALTLALVLLGALLAALPGAVAAAETAASAPDQADAASPSTPACGAGTAQLAVPETTAPVLAAGPADPTAAGGSCTRCAFNGQTCWCDPCPSYCESCPPGGIEGFCWFGTCQVPCAY